MDDPAGVKSDLPSTRIYMEPPASKQMNPQISKRAISRVVKVNGLPPMLSKEEIKKAFDQCGRITNVWKNNVNDCFIEFENEKSASNAVIMTGFTFGIEGDAAFSPQLIVNYALADEAKSHVIPFSKEACNIVSEKLSDESTLSEGTEILSNWFKNGECNRNNADDFFNLLQITSAAAEKEDKARKNKDETEAKLNETVSDIADYLSVLDQVFNHENFNSILVNFSDQERQNLLQWKKEFEEAKVEIKNDQEQHKKGRNKKNKRSAKKKPAMEVISREELLQLKQEKEDLELQLDVANLALVNERIEQQQQIDALKHSVLQAQRQCAEYEAQLADWRAIQVKLQKTDDLPEETDGLSSTEAKILTELSTYLGERLGATLSDIRTHLRRKDFHCTAKSIAQLMRRFPALFKEESVGAGPTMKIKWVFIGCRV